MKKRLMIYPFNEEFCPVLRHSDFPDYQIEVLVSPKGWGLESRDGGTIDGGQPLGLKIKINFEDHLKEVDAILFIDSDRILDHKKIIIPKMKEAIRAGKDIISTLPLGEEDLRVVKKLALDEGVDFTYYNQNQVEMERVKHEILEEITTPVIFVLGLSERTNKFDLQLSLRNELMEKGYTVTQIGSRKYCELLGFHSIPDFMFKPEIETKKVVSFNRYVKQLEKDENPDVILIGIPGGVMTFNNKLTNGFGILAYEMAQAVKPDTSVLSLTYDQYLPEFFEKMTRSLKYKLDCPVDAFNLANTKVNWDMSNQNREFVYITLDREFIDEKKVNYQSAQPIFNILNSTDGIRLTDHLIDVLAGYAEVGYL